MIKPQTTLLIFLLCLLPGIADGSKAIMVFAGSASQPPLEEAAESFEAETGIPVILHLGGSGAMLSQARLTRRGDVYIPGSPDYMELAQRQELVAADIETIAYLVPAIIVPRGNPQNIQELHDLSRPGLRIGMADPDGVCVGLYAVEILESNQLAEAVRPNLHGMVESCAKVAALIPLKMADVVLGWREFSAWAPDKLETVRIKPEQLPRLATIPAATFRHSSNKSGAGKFIAYLKSASGQEIFNKWGYLTNEASARKFAPQAKLGGTYVLPQGW